jgi:hypothetical protein
MTRTIPPKRKLSSLNSLDGRTALARQARDLQRQIAADLGGEDILTTAQKILIQRVALLHVFCTHCEAQWLTGDELDSSYQGAVGALRHVLAHLGLKRVPRPVPSLQEYLATKYGAQHDNDH